MVYDTYRKNNYTNGNQIPETQKKRDVVIDNFPLSQASLYQTENTIWSSNKLAKFVPKKLKNS